MIVNFEWSWSAGTWRQPWLSIFMASVGAVLLGVCIYLVYKQSTAERDAIHTKGKVVSHISSGTTRNGNPLVKAVISFRDQDNNDQKVISSVSGYPPPFNIGEEVEVLYPKQHPTEAWVNSFLENWFVPLVAGGIGATHILVAALMWRFRRRLFSQYRARNKTKPSPNAQAL